MTPKQSIHKSGCVWFVHSNGSVKCNL